MESSISKLLKVISDLRDPNNGCPWDLSQTHKSLIPYVLEEAHEVADAIRNGDDKNLIEELGDLLLQIVLHAQLANEENRFCFEDIIDVVTKKMIRRHPHVFNTKKANDISEVNNIWEAIKQSEKEITRSKSPLSDDLKLKTRSQSSIYGAMTISKKVAKAGFEWSSKDEVWDQLDKEIQELKNTIDKESKCSAEEQLGDVFFTLINIARWNSLNPEESLAVANKKFLSWVSFLEKQVNGNISDQPIDYLRELWAKAKKYIVQNNNI